MARAPPGRKRQRKGRHAQRLHEQGGLGRERDPFFQRPIHREGHGDGQGQDGKPPRAHGEIGDAHPGDEEGGRLRPAGALPEGDDPHQAHQHRLDEVAHAGLEHMAAVHSVDINAPV